MNNCILRQSVFQNNVPVQQLSNLQLSGINTMVDMLNNDNGKLYGILTQSSGMYVFDLYKDNTLLDMVASGASAELGLIDLYEENASGITGSVNLAQYIAADTMIEVWCCFSVDGDLPMANLEGINDYDPTVGFAEFHLLAFNKIVEIITAKYRSILRNPTLIDTNNLNGALGGWDLAKCNNLAVLRDPSRYYALMLICERQSVEPGSIFDMRRKDAMSIFKGHMETIELTFDLAGTRVDDKSRSLSTFKITRA